MKKKVSAKYSAYIIDGVQQELTPAQILDSCLAEVSIAACSSAQGEPEWEPIVDETIDPSYKDKQADPACIAQYQAAVLAALGKPRPFPLAYPETRTKSVIASALLDVIWRKGHFTLQDLALKLDWRWPVSHIGDMAAFYASATAAADYTDSLGLRLKSWSYKESEEASLTAKPFLCAQAKDHIEYLDEDMELIQGSDSLSLGRKLAHPTVLQPERTDWIVFIPFDDCDFRLGGSLLAEIEGLRDHAPQIVDPDYFIDCYEVVRELVEDNVVLAGATVSRGGLMATLSWMASAGVGVEVDLSDLVSAYGESCLPRILFSEVPGVVIQIADDDFDYIDAELLLQDVAYFPLGHPVPGAGVSVASAMEPGIKKILESLIRSQSSEGED